MPLSSSNHIITFIILQFGLYFMHILLKFLFPVKYSKILQQCGITFDFPAICWFTPRFNRSIQRISTWCYNYQERWFFIGMWMTLIAIPPAIYFILQSTIVLFANVFWPVEKSINGPAPVPYLEPYIPGINAPLADIGYYLGSLMFCSIFHELGHALTAVREGLHVEGCGIIFMFILPAAYVRINNLESIHITKRLNILCAGVWHNIVLVLNAALIILFSPFFFRLVYDYGKGVQVISMHAKLPLSGEGGLAVGDVITNLNNCPVSNEFSWLSCIRELSISPINGYCLTSEFVNVNDESTIVKQYHNVIECCSNNTLSGICFEYLEESDNPIELPQYSCLNVRAVLHESTGKCFSTSDCTHLHCFRPSLTNGTKLMQIKTRESEKEVLFLGYPSELFSVHITEFVTTNFFSPSIPIIILKFCNFIIMFSGALAAVNLIPCFHFDGQHITRCLVDIYLTNSIPLSGVRLAISLSITILGTIVLVIYTILMFSTVVF